MDTGSQWAIIVALAGTLSGVVGWVGRYLLTRIGELEEALKQANAATAAANAVNARLAELWIEQHTEPRPSSSRSERR